MPLTPTWCPGCGNFGIFGAITAALKELRLTPKQTVFVYDVGCSGNMADFLPNPGFHGLHGRAIPLAAGIKLGNPQQKVFVIIGDGGAYGEGAGHFLEACLANFDLTVIVHNNGLYSLTTGQKSPTTPQGTITPSTPDGVIETAFNPLSTALVNSATFVARGFSGHIPQLTDLIVKGTKHVGLALIDVLQPCITFNKIQTYAWYRERLYDLQANGHNPADFNAALRRSAETEKLPTGIFYQTSRKSFHEYFNWLD